MLSGRHLYPRALRRALRAAGFPRRAPRPLPDSLRDRLLSIPATTPAPRVVADPMSLRFARADLAPGPSWLLTSPLASIAASFVLAVAVSFFFGNPYEAGAATLDEVKGEISPVAMRLCAGATRVAAAASGAGEAALDALPRAGLSASRAISRTVQERVSTDDATAAAIDGRTDRNDQGAGR